MDILQHYLIALYATAFSVFVLALFVYFKSPQKTVNRTFAFYSICIVIWGLGQALHNSAADRETAVFWAKFFHSGVFFISTGFVHFALSLIHIEKIKGRLIKSLYFISFSFFLLNFTDLIIAGAEPKFSLNYYWITGPVYPLFLIYWMASVCYALALLFKAYRSATRSRQIQLKFLFWSSLIGYIGGISNYLPAFNIHLYPYNPFATYAVPLYSIVVAYTITRYRFMDIHIVIKRTAVYSLSAGLLTVLFVVLVLVVTNLFSSFAKVSSFKVSIFVAILIAILFNPLRNKVQEMVDKVFYKTSYDYYATIQKVSSALASMFDLQRIYEYIGNIIYDVMGLKSIYLLTANTGSGFELVYHASRKMKTKSVDDESEKGDDSVRLHNRSGIVRMCKKSRNILIRDELSVMSEMLGREEVERINSELKPFNGEAAVPVLIDGKLSTLMILSEKASGDMFTNEDINLLRTIADQTSIAMKNAGLYREKVHSERLASIGMMSATFAHEIRNPLTSLKTFAQLMPEKYNDEEFRNTFSKIVVGEIERIDGLIGDLLDFSSDKKSGRVNNFNLTVLIDETVEYIKSKLNIDKKNIVIEKDYPESEVAMSGDAAKLKQAFINLFMNGCQAMNGDGTLTIRIIPNGKNVDVAVKDTGDGIRPEDIAKIFDPFVTTKEMGVGLGLAISKRIVEDHNGKITVKSKLSKGSTFTISLPVQNP